MTLQMNRAAATQTIRSGSCLVLAPGLLSGVVGANTLPPTDNLCRLLGFAEQVEIPHGEWPSIESLGAQTLLPGQESTCAALLTYARDFGQTTVDNSPKVLRADPAYQQIDMNNATLGNPLELDITAAECTALQETLNHHFSVDGIRFECKDPSRWYCHFESLPQVITTPVSAAIGRDVAECRPTGADARTWRSKLAEIEMLLFEHEVNKARLNSNRLPVNTLWLWGEGSPVPGNTHSAISVFSDNFYVQSVADYVGADCQELSYKPLVITPENGMALLAIDKFTNPATHLENAQTETYAKSLQWFDQGICEPLWQGLKSGACSEVTLWLGDDRLFRVSSSVKKQFFRRLFTKSKPLSAYLPDNQMPPDPTLMQRS